MKNLPLKPLLVLATLLLVVQCSTYTLMEREQALIFEMGRVRKAAVKEAGLHWKVPFIHEVKRFDKRILILDGSPSEIPTRDKKFILVDTTARWKIEDPVKFYKSFISNKVYRAVPKISSILDGITKDTISNFNLVELVRNSNKILQDFKDNQAERMKELKRGNNETNLEDIIQEIEPIKQGREKISEIITERAGKVLLEQFGVRLVGKVQLKSIAYRDVVEKKVYTRMISERMKIATRIRSVGLGEKAKIEGQLNLSLKRIESEAYRKSQEIKGKADAEAINIYAASMKEDPEFYSFIQTLETYKKTLGEKNNFILSTDNKFLELFARGK